MFARVRIAMKRLYKGQAKTLCLCGSSPAGHEGAHFVWRRVRFCPSAQCQLTSHGGKVFQGTHPCAASPDVIITRNTKHFEGLSIPVKEPSDFLDDFLR